MNINPKIITALAPLGLPVRQSVYILADGESEKPEQYFVFFTYSDQLGNWASGTAVREDIIGQISLFSKLDWKETVEQAVILLRDAGFAVSLGQEFYEEDTGYYHQVIDIAWHENLYGR